MSQAARSRLSVSVLAAIVCLLGLRELRGGPSALGASGQPTPAATVPAEAVSISTLVADGREVRVGESAADAVRALDASARPRVVSEDRGAVGRRQIRVYDRDGSNVTVVLEPFETRGALRVAAIYLR